MKPTYTHQVYKDARGEYRWRVTHKNGNIIADGGQGYSRAIDARRAFRNMLNSWDNSRYGPQHPSFMFELKVEP